MSNIFGGVMTKEQLKEYRALVLESEQLESELNTHLNSSYIGTSIMDGLPKGSELSDTTAKLAIKTIELYAMFNAKKLEIITLRKEIEVCIDKLSPLERVLMRERYILGKDWEEVCVAINYSWRQAHRLHSKIITTLKISP